MRREDFLRVMTHAIVVWRFDAAPAELRALSKHGGDEDWVLLAPKEEALDIWWAQEGGAFGCCSVSEHILDDGSVVMIGAHA